MTNHVKYGELADYSPAAISCYSLAIQHSVCFLQNSFIYSERPHVISLTCQAVLSCHTGQSLSCNPPTDVRELEFDPWQAVILQDACSQRSV